jgi:hypothetical protein
MITTERISFTVEKSKCFFQVSIPRNILSLGSKRIQKKINTYRQSKGIREIIRSNDSLLIRGEPHAVDLLLADINGDYLGAQKDFDDKKFVIQYIDIPFGVHNFIIGTKGVNIKNYQSMEGIKTIFLKDDRLHIEREKDTVDLVMARALNALNLVEMTVVGNMEMQCLKRSSNFF